MSDEKFVPRYKYKIVHTDRATLLLKNDGYRIMSMVIETSAINVVTPDTLNRLEGECYSLWECLVEYKHSLADFSDAVMNKIFNSLPDEL